MSFEWRTYVREHPRFGGYYRAVEGKPSWVIRAAAVCAVLVIVVPLVMLVLAAAVVGVVVFFGLGLVARVMRALGELFGGREQEIRKAGEQESRGSTGGRENVRVIHR